jgi:hypothetical protein
VTLPIAIQRIGIAQPSEARAAATA